MAKKKEDNGRKPKVTKVTRVCECKLTADEFAERSDLMAKKVEEAETIEAQRKNVDKDYKARISSAELEASRLSSIIINKSEPRDVECEEIIDFENDEFRVMRTDTYEVISRRRLQPCEKMEQLTIVGGSND